MKRIFSVTVMIAILATMATVAAVDTIPDVEALKGKGVDSSKYGSATKRIVCGDMLCSEMKQTGSSDESTTKIKPLHSSSMPSGEISVDSIIGATMKGTEIDKQSGTIVVSIDAQDDGKIIVNLDSTIKDVFMVIVDGEEWDDVFIDGSEIKIYFYAGAEKIEIIGNILN